MIELNTQTVEDLAQAVRDGSSLRSAIAEAGLPFRPVTRELQKRHRPTFKAAKVEQREALARMRRK